MAQNVTHSNCKRFVSSIPYILVCSNYNDKTTNPTSTSDDRELVFDNEQRYKVISFVLGHVIVNLQTFAVFVLHVSPLIASH